MSPAPDTAAELALVVATFPPELGIVWTCESKAGQPGWDGEHPRRIIGQIAGVPRTRVVLECMEDSIGEEGWTGGLLVGVQGNLLSRFANANQTDLVVAAPHLMRALPSLAEHHAESAEVYYRDDALAEALRALAARARATNPTTPMNPTTPAAPTAANGAPDAHHPR